MLYLLMIVFVQIVAESFPISSSGSCALLTRLLELYTPMKSIDMGIDIDFLMHGPTIVVLVLYFYPVIHWYIVQSQTIYKELFSLAIASLIAGHITALGFLFIRLNAVIQLPVWSGLIITAFLLFSLPFVRTMQTKKQLSYRDATLLGCVQALSLLPGISRFASTFVAARWLGFYPHYAFGYSFLLQVPLLGAAFLKGLYGLYVYPELLNYFSWQLLAVVLCASFISYLGFVWVGRLIQREKLWLFGWYVLATAVSAYAVGL